MHVESFHACSSFQFYIGGSEVLCVIKLCLDIRSFYFGREKMSSIVPVCVKLNRKDIPKNCSNVVLVINSFIMLKYKAIIWGLKKREFCKFSMVLAILNNVLTLWWILNYQLVPCVLGNIPRPYLAK